MKCAILLLVLVAVVYAKDEGPFGYCPNGVPDSTLQGWVQQYSTAGCIKKRTVDEVRAKTFFKRKFGIPSWFGSSKTPEQKREHAWHKFNTECCAEEFKCSQEDVKDMFKC